jgi:hypothetical protein
MKTILVLLFSLYTSFAGASSDSASTSVSSTLPIFVNGQRLEPRDGVHRISVSRETGLMIDAVLYMPVQYFPPYVPSVRADGMHYACEAAWRAGGAVFDSTGNRETARDAMLAFWKREFGDSLVVIQKSEWDFELSMPGQPGSPVMLSLACFDGYHPECQLTDNFQAVAARYHEIVDSLNRGCLLLPGQGYEVSILPADAPQALEEIEARLRQPRPAFSMVGDELIYAGWKILDGKYVLDSPTVRDLLGYR